MSASVADTRSAVAGIGAVMERPEPRGSRVLGAHMEAPFLAESKCGAQLKEFFCDPSMAALEEMTGGHTAWVRLLTMAPERPERRHLSGKRFPAALPCPLAIRRRPPSRPIRRRNGAPPM